MWLVFIEAKDDGGGGDDWSYRSCKAPVKSSSPTNQHPVFYRPDALPVAQPTVSKHWRENITFHGLAYPKLTWGLPTLSLTTNNSWLPLGRVAMPPISRLMPVLQKEYIIYGTVLYVVDMQSDQCQQSSVLRLTAVLASSLLLAV